MKRQKYIVGVGVFSILVLLELFFGVSAVHAENIILPATPISQRFSPADPNGDNGLHNCMPASLAIALQTLVAGRQLSLGNHQVNYASVRQIVRRNMPDPTRGIAPHILIEATQVVTKNSFHLKSTQTDSESWHTLLTGELEKGYPVLVHVSDRNSLYTPYSRTNASHVVVVYGVDESSVYLIDPWDGQLHRLSKERFAYAWGKGHYNWLAFTFEKQSEPEFATFNDILHYRLL